MGPREPLSDLLISQNWKFNQTKPRKGPRHLRLDSLTAHLINLLGQVTIGEAGGEQVLGPCARKKSN